MLVGHQNFYTIGLKSTFHFSHCLCFSVFCYLYFMAAFHFSVLLRGAKNFFCLLCTVSLLLFLLASFLLAFRVNFSQQIFKSIFRCSGCISCALFVNCSQLPAIRLSDVSCVADLALFMNNLNWLITNFN